MQEMLAQWITLKAMIGEQNQRHYEEDEIVIPRYDRDEFRKNRTVPPYFHIWIARYIAFFWRHTYWRHAGFIASPLKIPSNTRGKNAQTTTFGVGELFTYAMVCRAEGVNLAEFITLNAQFVPLWPPPGKDIQWPPPLSIDDRGADAAALAFAALLDSPATIWPR
jgi:hypothetical protein